MFRFAVLFAALLALSACQSSEERAEEHYQSALALLAEGDLARASVEFRNVFQLDGTHVEARRAFAIALRNDGQIQQAYSQFLRLAEQRPDDVDVRLALADMAMEIQNWEQLRLHGVRALDLVPEDQRPDPSDNPQFAVIATTMSYADSILAEDASARRDAADQALDLLDVVPESLPLFRLLVDAAVRDGDMRGALELIDAALVSHPERRDLHDTRLALLAQEEDALGVERQLQDMITRFPEDGELVATLMRIYISLERLDAAEAFLREQIAVEDDPEQAASLRATLVQFLVQVEGTEAALMELDALIASFPEDLRYRMLRAGIQFANGERDSGIAEMETLVDGAEASGPLNDARIALAQMYTETGNLVGARRLVGEVLEVDGTHVSALKMEAASLINEDRADDAIGLLRRALDEAPRDVDAMTLMASAHGRNGNRDLMRDFLALAYEAANAAPAETLRYADNLTGDTLYLAAEEALITALRLQPSNLDLLERLGRIYIAMEDWPRAEQVEVSLRRLDLAEAGTLADSLQASRLAARDQLDDAIAFLQTLAEDGDENSLGAQIAVVRALLANGQVNEALAYAREAAGGAPENVALLMTRAATEAASGDRDAAIATYREIIALQPRFERAWVELIRSEFARGDREAARDTLDQALETLPEGVELLWAQASFLEQAGDIEGAIDIYERLYQNMPNSAVVANNLASLISTYRTDPENLERAYTIARRLRGTEIPPLMDTYGWITFRRGDIVEARPYLEGAAEALPDDPLVQFHYGMLLAQSGDRAGAIDQLNRALELAGPDDTRSQFETARTELDRLQGEEPDGQ